MLRQRSSHLQNCKSARMSRRIAVEQKRYAAGMADTEGWQFETCWTTQELRMRIAFSTVHKKTFIFYYVTVSLYEQLLRRQNRYGEPLWSIRLNCQLKVRVESSFPKLPLPLKVSWGYKMRKGIPRTTTASSSQELMHDFSGKGFLIF